MSFTPWWKGVASAGRRSAGIFLRDVGHGLLEVSHNMLALLGLLVLAAVAFMAGRADLRTSFEQTALGWLQERHGAHAEDLDLAALTADAEAPRAVATELSGLSRQQGAVAMWLSRRYRVAPEPVARLVQESWRVGQRVGVATEALTEVAQLTARAHGCTAEVVVTEGFPVTLNDPRAIDLARAVAITDHESDQDLLQADLAGGEGDLFEQLFHHRLQAPRADVLDAGIHLRGNGGDFAHGGIVHRHGHPFGGHAGHHRCHACSQQRRRGGALA